MYVKNDLFEVFLDQLSSGGTGPSLKNYFHRRSFDLINTAINYCDHWGSFVDIGGGDGIYACALIKKFRNGTVVEATKRDILDRMAENSGNLKIIYGLVPEVKLSGSLDFVLLSDVFEHMSEERALRLADQVAEAQPRGGVVHVATPNPAFCGPAEQSGIYFERDSTGHHKHYAPQELEAIFRSRGYDIVDRGFEERPFRQSLKSFYSSLTRRDDALRKLKRPLSVVRYVFVWLSNLVLRLFDGLVLADELFYRESPRKAMTQYVTFKKMR